MRLLPRKAEHLVLLGPFDWQVGEARNPHAVGEPAIDGRFDQIRREESKRDCHVDLSRAAVFSICDAVGTRCWIGDQFIKPTAAAGNRRDQSRARPRTYRTHLLRTDPLGQENFPAPSSRRLPPRDLKSARLLATCYRFWCLSKMNDQLVRLNLDARDVSIDKTAVINGLRRFEMVPNRFDDQRLDRSCRNTAH
jgi:hypothetical protein